MSLFALYHSWRSWQQTDSYVVVIILTLLLLLVIFNRGKSFLANGVFSGCAFGCLCAVMSDEVVYRKKMGYVELGILMGLLLGWLAKMIFPLVKKPLPEKLEPAEPTTKSAPGDGSHGLAFWVSALAISGISVGLTLAAIFRMAAQESLGWIAGLFLAGCVLGVAAGPASRKMSWLQASFELWIIITLTTGIGTIIGWKMVLPILLFDVNPPVSSEVLFRMATYSSAAVGGLIGSIAWTARTLRQRRAKPSSTPAP